MSPGLVLDVQHEPLNLNVKPSNRKIMEEIASWLVETQNVDSEWDVVILYICCRLFLLKLNEVCDNLYLNVRILYTRR